MSYQANPYLTDNSIVLDKMAPFPDIRICRLELTRVQEIWQYFGTQK